MTSEIEPLRSYLRPSVLEEADERTAVADGTWTSSAHSRGMLAVLECIVPLGAAMSSSCYPARSELAREGAKRKA
ncbi:MAG TPA: hypothetical protein VFP84_39105 [Kofleriaceae bacterium]|nr:hypothetical protein [Kofleriaceae bacterium]